MRPDTGRPPSACLAEFTWSRRPSEARRLLSMFARFARRQIGARNPCANRTYVDCAGYGSPGMTRADSWFAPALRVPPPKRGVWIRFGHRPLRHGGAELGRWRVAQQGCFTARRLVTVFVTMKRVRPHHRIPLVPLRHVKPATKDAWRAGPPVLHLVAHGPEPAPRGRRACSPPPAMPVPRSASPLRGRRGPRSGRGSTQGEVGAVGSESATGRTAGAATPTSRSSQRRQITR